MSLSQVRIVSPTSAPGEQSMPVRSLVLLGLLSLALCTSWIVVLPPWQGPDEPAHYSYIERLADGKIPPIEGGEIHFSAAVGLSVRRALDSYRVRGARPLTPHSEAILVPAEPDGLSTAGQAAAGATNYPPLYYTMMLPFYELGSRAVERLYWVRFGSALIAVAFTILTSLLVLDATGSRRLAMGSGVLATLPPMLCQAGAIVSPDVLLAAGSAGAMLALRRAARTPTRRRVVAALVALSIVALSKPVGLPMVVALVVSFAGPSTIRLSTRSQAAAAASVVALLLGGAYAVRFALASTLSAHPFASAREFASYLWQFYLPRLGFMQPLFQDSVLSQPVPVWGTFVRTGVGYFGWISAPMPEWSYVAVVAGTLAALAVSIGPAIRHRFAFALQWVTFIVLLLAILHLADFAVLATGGGSIMQGRYLLPAIPAGLVVFCVPLAAASNRIQRTAMSIAIGTWMLSGAVGLSSALEFYAT